MSNVLIYIEISEEFFSYKKNIGFWNFHTDLMF